MLLASILNQKYGFCISVFNKENCPLTIPSIASINSVN